MINTILMWGLGILFFLISNKDIYSRRLLYAEKHKEERKVQRERKRKKKKERKRY